MVGTILIMDSDIVTLTMVIMEVIMDITTTTITTIIIHTIQAEEALPIQMQ